MQQTRTLHPVAVAVREKLKAQRITKSELARRLGWGRMQVQRRLDSDPDFTVPELEQVAEVLGVPLSALLPVDDQPAQVTS